MQFVNYVIKMKIMVNKMVLFTSFLFNKNIVIIFAFILHLF